MSTKYFGTCFPTNGTDRHRVGSKMGRLPIAAPRYAQRCRSCAWPRRLRGRRGHKQCHRRVLRGIATPGGATRSQGGTQRRGGWRQADAQPQAACHSRARPDSGRTSRRPFHPRDHRRAGTASGRVMPGREPREHTARVPPVVAPGENATTRGAARGSGSGRGGAPPRAGPRTRSADRSQACPAAHPGPAHPTIRPSEVEARSPPSQQPTPLGGKTTPRGLPRTPEPRSPSRQQGAPARHGGCLVQAFCLRSADRRPVASRRRPVGNLQRHRGRWGGGVGTPSGPTGRPTRRGTAPRSVGVAGSGAAPRRGEGDATRGTNRPWHARAPGNAKSPHGKAGAGRSAGPGPSGTADSGPPAFPLHVCSAGGATVGGFAKMHPLFGSALSKMRTL